MSIWTAGSGNFWCVENFIAHWLATSMDAGFPVLVDVAANKHSDDGYNLRSNYYCPLPRWRCLLQTVLCPADRSTPSFLVSC